MALSRPSSGQTAAKLGEPASVDALGFEQLGLPALGPSGLGESVDDEAEQGASFDVETGEGLQGDEAHCAVPSDQGLGAALSASDDQLCAWMLEIAQHDEQALADFYDATASRVHAFVMRIVGRSAWADEVVGDTYFQLWRQAPRFDPARGRPITWLMAMARSRAIDHLRREARFHAEPLSDDQAQGTASVGAAPAADDLLQAAREHAQLHRALLSLGAQPRQLVALAFLRGLSHEEIALQTQLPLGTVKSQIRRALASLKQQLGQGAAGAAKACAVLAASASTFSLGATTAQPPT